MKLDAELLAAERAIDEARCGRPILVRDALTSTVYAPIETIVPAQLARLHGWADAGLSLVVSAERALALGDARGAAPGAGRVALPNTATLADALRLATAELRGEDPTAPSRTERVSAGDRVDRLVVRLLKAAWLLPAAVRVAVAAAHTGELGRLIEARVLHVVGADGLARMLDGMHQQVQKVSEARVPLLDAPEARFVCFRTALAGREHLAVVIGDPDHNAGVPVRLHSACLTGDVFGSLRCDCGDQLRQSVAALRRLGGGVLLYLAQEGRGIGLGNKLRAYALQDQGRDTIDADQQLGFSPDERQYGIAASMLLALGCKRIRLLTNNPDKIEALSRAGISIVERLPLLGDITPQNQRYMDAKRLRARHLLDPTDG